MRAARVVRTTAVPVPVVFARPPWKVTNNRPPFPVRSRPVRPGLPAARKRTLDLTLCSDLKDRMQTVPALIYPLGEFVRIFASISLDCKAVFGIVLSILAVWVCLAEVLETRIFVGIVLVNVDRVNRTPGE